MMKKIIALAICLLFLVSLTSCSSITKFEKCHPTQQQMTKWVGDCEELCIELYICDDDRFDSYRLRRKEDYVLCMVASKLFVTNVHQRYGGGFFRRAMASFGNRILGC